MLDLLTVDHLVQSGGWNQSVAGNQITGQIREECQSNVVMHAWLGNVLTEETGSITDITWWYQKSKTLGLNRQLNERDLTVQS